MEIKFKNIQKKIINKKILIITGQNSFKFSGARDRILKLLKKKIPIYIIKRDDNLSCENF